MRGSRPEFFDGLERARLCDLFDELGPDAPTLLAPWTTRDIAAHLLLRDRDPLAAPGLVVPGPWSRFAARRQQALAEQDFGRLTATLRSGPPAGFFRLTWVRRLPSLNEFFVHHEDVLRANNQGPRACTPALNDALWQNVRHSAWFLTRHLHGTALELHRAGTASSLQVRRHPSPGVHVTGDPGELLLYLFGRQTAAQVAITGPPPAIEATRRAHFGM